MNQRAIDVLEYSRIINELAKRAGSEMTRTVISGFLPGSNRREIEDALVHTFDPLVPDRSLRASPKTFEEQHSLRRHIV